MIRCQVHLLQAGSCRHPEAMARLGAPWTPAVFPALAVLVIHPKIGPVLFDTGYDPAFFAATAAFPERFYRWATPVDLPDQAAVADQLHRFGIGRADIQAIVISHFHGDHVAGLHAFPDADIFCARAGLSEITSRSRWGRVRRGLLSGLLPDDIQSRARFFEDTSPIALGAEMSPFDAGADLFGDGSLIAVPLPGHCPGHWGLAVTGEDDRKHFFVADAAWSRRAVRDNCPPPRVTTALLGRTDDYRRTLSQLHHLAGRNTDVLITPSHCPEAAAAAAAQDG